GAFYGAKLFEMDPRCVSVIAGGERHARLRETGLVVNGKGYDLPLVRPEDASHSDLILVAVKHHHLPQAILDMRKAVGDRTHILSVMNGIQSEEQIGDVYGMDKVLYAIAIGIDAVREGNVVTCSTQGKILFGEPDNSVLSERVKSLQELFTKAGIVHDTPVDMIRTLWWKFMVNVGMNQVSAILDAPYGVFHRSEAAQKVTQNAMNEVIAIANAKGINLSKQDAVDFLPILRKMSPEGKTSMVQDIEAKRKTEVEMFGVKVVEMGLEMNIPTPVNSTLVRLIQALEEKGREHGA
ncbi:MAG: 2-dehydropantoate 2-reductase, partial [Desulfobacteraceae bacterium]